MKRKVIQIADSTQLISLPREWGKKYNIKKGDELEVEMKGNKLEISTEKDIQLEKITLDISGLDRTSIIFYIRSAYRRGYNLIEIIFDKDLANHLRLEKEIKIISIIHEEVNRLIGVEIIQEKEHFCVIKDISNASFKDFEIVLRRIFLLFLDAAKEFFDGLKTANRVKIDSIEEKHNTIMKFVSYALRLLNKSGFSEQHKNSFLSVIITMLSKISDILKYSGREFINADVKLSKLSIDLTDNFYNSYNVFYELFYKFDIKKIYEIYKIRDLTYKKIREIKGKISKDELAILEDLKQTLNICVGLIETKMCLSF